MSSSTTPSSKVERRGQPRETLQCAVLVYFDDENWGNLIEINEGGMSIACAEPLPVHERMNFTFQIKGCMPIPHAGKVFWESFQEAGEILWTRALGCIAGVRFLDLGEASREQIRRWVSIGKPRGTRFEGTSPSARVRSRSATRRGSRRRTGNAGISRGPRAR